MKQAKVHLIDIGYTTALGSDRVKVHSWGEFDTKDAAIRKVSQIVAKLGSKERELLQETGCCHFDATNGLGQLTPGTFYILYPDEQREWIRDLVEAFLQ